MSRPTPLSGYPEWLPAQRAVEQQVVDELRRTFELHGFAGIETRAVEPMAQLLRKGEIDKEVYVVSPAARRRRRRAGVRRPPARAALRPHRAVRPLRAGELRQAAVPVPPLPDPEGVAGRAPAGGPLPRVLPGRHRRGRRRRAAVPPRHRGRRGDGRGDVPAAAAAAADAGQQPQARAGLLPRAWASRTSPPCCARSTSSTRSVRTPSAPPWSPRGTPSAVADACLRLAAISGTDASVVERGPRPRRALRRAGRGPARARRAAGRHRRTSRLGPGGRGAEDRPRPRLLHRHRHGDGHGGLRAAGLDQRRAVATTRWPATAAPPTRASASRSG